MATERSRPRLVGAAQSPASVLVDSRVILDVVTGDPTWSEWSADRIARARDEGVLVVSPLIYAEISVGFDTVEALDEMLGDDYERHPLPWSAGFLAGKAFKRYRANGGQKRSPLPDFYIGAHAAVAGHRLLTRDAARYRTYFPRLDIIAPP
ncbi:type II toxin-antitoxin system VapC family toxin [Streptomyces sp. GC420]|uniref:type II toxin-antitoxin system VapC family toxin n=1 Tax=Streptomyces sp. GC420 TaxID=2697568 RepID=UPI001414E037|nr:type II toxin-antitoxin system VapC family toxin [Streptomyces sp. GC420]NBM14773.1 PIN domain-containing protein [Streptomyces sp. GC420]